MTHRLMTGICALDHQGMDPWWHLPYRPRSSPAAIFGSFERAGLRRLGYGCWAAVSSPVSQAHQPSVAQKREASGFTRARPWTNRNNASCPAIQGQLQLPSCTDEEVTVGLAAVLGKPWLARAATTSVLKYVPAGTRCHGFMVFDTLYGHTSADLGFVATPQMIAGHTIENVAGTWYLQLRDGLLFHDGTKVLARDCVASIRR
jgi:ABC-type transport system substrate-binding protein